MTPQEEWKKKVRRILVDPDGRAALKEFGIDVEMVDEKKPDAIPTVVILCPTYRAPDPQMQDALRAMVIHTNESGKARAYAGAPMASSVVHWSRNGLISEHLKSGKPWTHVLFIDDDMVVEPDYLLRMLAHQKDIVCGLATRRQDPPIPNIRHFEEETGDFRQIWEWPEGKLIEVGAGGTGLALISQNALEQVAQAYFNCEWEKEFYGLAGERLEKLSKARLEHFDKNKIAYWFRFLPAFSTPIEYGEDIGFCLIAKRYCGVPTFVDTTVQPGHIGPYPFSIRDFQPYRDQCVLKAKLDGTYPMEVPPMKISILCPTRGRPTNVSRLVASAVETATIAPEFIFYVDDDCESMPWSLTACQVRTIRGPRICLSEMWNRCAEAATGDILMHAGDDIVFKTKGWDDQVRRAFAAFPDRMVFVHGDDGVYGNRFGTHGFLHRAWVDAVGYFCPPYFSSDYNDTWFNDVFNAIDRRIALPFVTEHMHPLVGKAEWDKTHGERLERGKRDNVKELYEKLMPEREADIDKIKARLGKAYSDSEQARPSMVAGAR